MLQYILMSLVVAVIVYDLYVLAQKGYDKTISWQMFVVGRNYPIIPFLIGITFGHVFWPNTTDCIVPYK